MPFDAEKPVSPSRFKMGPPAFAAAGLVILLLLGGMYLSSTKKQAMAIASGAETPGGAPSPAVAPTASLSPLPSAVPASTNGNGSGNQP
jgi:hypothetical protein